MRRGHPGCPTEGGLPLVSKRPALGGQAYWTFEVNHYTGEVERLNRHASLAQAKEEIRRRAATLVWTPPDGATSKLYWTAVSSSRTWLIEDESLRAPADEVPQPGRAGAQKR